MNQGEGGGGDIRRNHICVSFRHEEAYNAASRTQIQRPVSISGRYIAHAMHQEKRIGPDVDVVNFLFRKMNGGVNEKIPAAYA
jgi:hypothetical protein